MEPSKKVNPFTVGVGVKKRPMTLAQAFGYAVLATAVMVGFTALRDHITPEQSAVQEADRHAQETEAANREREQAQKACADNSIAAFVMSQDVVRARLKTPATAKFPTVTTPGVTTSYLGNCTHEVVAFVDSQNSFGAVFRAPYTVRLQEEVSTQRWKVLAIGLQEQW